MLSHVIIITHECTRATSAKSRLLTRRKIHSGDRLKPLDAFSCYNYNIPKQTTRASVFEPENVLLRLGIAETAADDLFDIRGVGPQPFENFFLLPESHLGLGQPPLAGHFELPEVVELRACLPKKYRRREADAHKNDEIKGYDEASKIHRGHISGQVENAVMKPGGGLASKGDFKFIISLGIPAILACVFSAGR